MYDISQQPEKMQERYRMLPGEIIELFEYGTVDQVLDDCIKEFGLREYQKPLLRMEVELILYFFLTRKRLVERLQQSLEIEKSRADLIAQKLDNDLFIIVDKLLIFAEEQYTNADSEEKAPPIIVTPPTTVVADTEKSASAPEERISSQPEEKPSVIVAPPTPEKKIIESTPVEVSKGEKYTQVKPLRTFAMDVDISRAHSYGATNQAGTEGEDEEPVHRSSQDDILKK